MAFADGAGAHHEAGRAGLQAVLVGVRDHRGIGQGRALDGDLVREQGPDQQPPLGVQVGGDRDTVPHGPEVLFEGRLQTAVAAAESADGLVVGVGDLAVVQTQDPLDDVGRPVADHRRAGPGRQQPSDDTAGVALQAQIAAGDEIVRGDAVRAAAAGAGGAPDGGGAVRRRFGGGHDSPSHHRALLQVPDLPSLRW